MKIWEMTKEDWSKLKEKCGSDENKERKKKRNPMEGVKVIIKKKHKIEQNKGG